MKTRRSRIIRMRGPSPPPLGTWPNEPVNSTLISDWGFDQDPPTGHDQPIADSPSPGWHTLQKLGQEVTRISDAGAPFSPSNVYQIPFPIDPNADGASGAYTTPASVTRLYAGFWMKWSNPWQAHSSGQKMDFVRPSGGQYDLCFLVQSDMRVITYFPGNQDNSHLTNASPDGINIFGAGPVTNITLGVWHRFERISKQSTTITSQDGVLKWWVDGVLLGDYTNVNFPTAPVAEYQIHPYWGGAPENRATVGTVWYDHVHISEPPA